MKKLMLMMFLIAGFGIGTHAQDVKKTPAHMAKQLVKKLSLTADQQSKIDAIMQTKAAHLDSLNTNAQQLSKKDLHKQKKTINDTAIEQINNVLTANQQKIYADFRTDQAAKMKTKKEAATPASSTPPAN